MVENLPIPRQQVAMWGFKTCQRCGGDMYCDNGSENWRCLQCGWTPSDEKLAESHKKGRKPKLIRFKIIYDTLRATNSIKRTAQLLDCSRGYIYQELKKQGLTAKEVIGE
ncbi:hypothetical protein ES703_104952 [subsurface metagenome]